MVQGVGNLSPPITLRVPHGCSQVTPRLLSGHPQVTLLPNTLVWHLVDAKVSVARFLYSHTRYTQTHLLLLLVWYLFRVQKVETPLPAPDLVLYLAIPVEVSPQNLHPAHHLAPSAGAKAVSGLTPPVPLWLLQVAAQRGAYGAERYEKMEFQRKVGQQFALLRDASWKVRWGPKG